MPEIPPIEPHLPHQPTSQHNRFQQQTYPDSPAPQQQAANQAPAESQQPAPKSPEPAPPSVQSEKQPGLASHKQARITIAVIQGPNLNMLGSREPDIYGHDSLEMLNSMLHQIADRHEVDLDTFQSNHEGALVDKIQSLMPSAAGIIINPGAYGHTSIALRDALAMIKKPVIEVHISNIYQRESFRADSMIAPVVTGTLSGLGIDGYRLALLWLIKHLGH